MDTEKGQKQKGVGKGLLGKLLNYETISYLVIGVLTTLVDWVSYGVMRVPLGYRAATVLSQVFAILFAYGTNKVFVFENFNFHLRYLMKEMASFFGCRLFTAVFTYVAMVVMVDGLKIQQDMLCKIAVSGISLVLNYVFSKWLIFRKGTAQKK